MKPELTNCLICPKCTQKLQLEVESVGQNDEVESGHLFCQNAHVFPVIDYIPRFVDSEYYAESFGIEWNLFERTQLDYKSQEAEVYSIYGGLCEVRPGEESEATFFLKTGLEPRDLRGKLVLDAGCGVGRFADVCSRYSAEVVGVDLSSSAASAFKNIGLRDSVHILQADIFNLPFPPGTFDIIFSIGVLHHTPNARHAFLSLLPLLKPGAQISIWVYPKRRWSFISDTWRVVTTRLPKSTLLRLSEIRARLHPIRKVPFIGRGFGILWPASQHPNYEWRVLNTFDWYSPKYQWKHTIEEVTGWFIQAGLTNVQALPVLVSVTGRRPVGLERSLCVE